MYNHKIIIINLKCAVQSTAVTVQRNPNIRKIKRKQIGLQCSVLDDVNHGGREFHVRDAAAGKARSPSK